MYTRNERISAAIGLIVAFLGLINAGLCKWSILSVAPKQLAILGFIPLAVVAFLVIRKSSK